jgi:hypothetical protein
MTQLLFRNEYRLDLKPVESILIPILFNQSNLIAVLESNSRKKFFGYLKQLLFPTKALGDYASLRLGSQAITFEYSGQFYLEFVPKAYERVTLSIYTSDFVVRSDEVLIDALNGNLNLEHQHQISSVEGLQATLDSKISYSATSWQNATYKSTWSNYASYSPLQYRVIDNKFVEITGSVSKNTTASSLEIVASIPQEFAPTKDLFVAVCPLNLSPDYYLRCCRVTQNGDIQIIKGVSTANFALSLSYFL